MAIGAAYRIFVSHRFNRPSVAAVNDIAAAIDELSENLEIVNPRRSIHAGFDWRSQLTDDLRSSDMLLLVYTDPHDDWSWCTFEAGLFTRLETINEPQPIVCLHHRAAVPPSQLNYLQCVSSDEDQIFGFLESLLRTTDITRSRWPLDRRIPEAALRRAAKTIADSFREVDTYYAVHRLVVQIPPEQEAAVLDAIPANATIVAATPGTRSLFGTIDNSIDSWGRLLTTGRERLPRQWLDELNSMFAKAAKRQDPGPSTATFMAHTSGEYLRPAIYSVERHGDRPYIVEILLVPEPAPSTVGSGVFGMMRSLERFKSEVLDRFLDRTAAQPQLASVPLAELIAPLDSITSEATKLGTFDPVHLRALFPRVVDDLSSLRDEFAEHARLLRTAIEGDDPEQALHHLIGIDEIVGYARTVAAQRHIELIDTDARIDLRDRTPSHLRATVEMPRPASLRPAPPAGPPG
jgi:hypothetical protein